MKIRLCYGRRVQTSLKLGVCILIAVFYFLFLFRESMNAFEQNKDKAEAAAIAAGLMQPQLKQQQSKIAVPAFKRFQREIAVDFKVLPRTVATEPIRAVLTASSTLNPVYEYSEELHSATESDLRQRRLHLQQTCEKYKVTSLYPPNPKEFFISRGHSLVWCNVFKAASSTWMYYFNILAGYDPKFLQKGNAPPIDLARKRFPRPNLQDLYDSLPSSVSFLFVRDPFERIVSGYRDKLEGGKNKYYDFLGNRIVKRYRKHPQRAGSSKGPTFNEFVLYLIDQNSNHKVLNEHWAPIYSFCTPCCINFDIIGKIETFTRDSEYIIRQAGVESLLLGKLSKSVLKRIGNLSKGMKTSSSLEKYFSEIDRSTLDKLINVYKLDFELFDYSYTKYYNLVRPNEGNKDNTSGAITQNHQGTTL